VVVQVVQENESVWAGLCVALWHDRSREFFISERHNGEFSDEFLYMVGKEAVAFISLSVRRDYVEGTCSTPAGYLEGIYVKPEFRMQGIASKLVEFAKQWSSDKGCLEFASDCLIENEESRKFHNNIGFKEANICVHFTMDLD